MRLIIYNFLVNRHAGINVRYHKLHDGSTGFVRLLSYVYLMWLNFAFYILQFRFLGKVPKVEVYESKRLSVTHSESEEYHNTFPDLRVNNYIEECMRYDVISFDIFDTLIFRPMAVPADVFYLVGERLNILDYRNIRCWAEYDCRMKCMELRKHMEIDINDIYKNIEEDVGLDPGKGIDTEIEIELSMCYANPFMKKVYDELIKLGKRVVITSDMYLPLDIIKRILTDNGYDNYEHIYLSNVYHKNKGKGDLYEELIRDYKGLSILHIGDNTYSDIKMAKKAGIKAKLYPNINHNIRLYRSEDMSYLIGSAYRGIVSSCIYNGLEIHNMEYEYGFIYGGLFVLGYCRYIHEYAASHNIDKLLFLSRDGDTLMKAYRSMYPDEARRLSYVYWSRKSATKLMYSLDKHDYFRRFICHKMDQGYSISDVLKSMELEELISQLSDWKMINDSWNISILCSSPTKNTPL